MQGPLRDYATFAVKIFTAKNAKDSQRALRKP